MDTEKITGGVKPKNVKTAKVYKKGKGITEEILFDDTFDWESLLEEPDEAAETVSSEKLVELDELKPEEIVPADTPPPAASSTGRRLPSKEEKCEKKEASEGKSASFLCISNRYGVAAVALFIFLTISLLGYIAAQVRPKSSSPETYQVTRSIWHPDRRYVRLEPFLVPVSENGVRGFCKVSALLVLHSDAGDLAFERREMIRGIIYSALAKGVLTENAPYRKKQLAQIIRGTVNNYLHTRMVRDVRLTIRDLIRPPGREVRSS